jgi:hypothetical protein
MSKNKRNITVLWLIALLLVPIILWILPGDFFDDGDLIICPSRFLFDIECFGCGMTRAVQHMHNFQWDDAVYYNTGVLFDLSSFNAHQISSGMKISCIQHIEQQVHQTVLLLVYLSLAAPDGINLIGEHTEYNNTTDENNVKPALHCYKSKALPLTPYVS